MDVAGLFPCREGITINKGEFLDPWWLLGAGIHDSRQESACEMLITSSRHFEEMNQRHGRNRSDV